MGYNGVGLKSAKGSSTSGHITKSSTITKNNKDSHKNYLKRQKENLNKKQQFNKDEMDSNNKISYGKTKQRVPDINDLISLKNTKKINKENIKSGDVPEKTDKSQGKDTKKKTIYDDD